MPFYTGKSADGSDATLFGGMYESPDGKEWSTTPYNSDWRPTTRREKRARQRRSDKQRNIYGSPLEKSIAYQADQAKDR